MLKFLVSAAKNTQAKKVDASKLEQEDEEETGFHGEYSPSRF